MVKKIATSIITLAVLMGSVVACGGSDSANNASSDISEDDNNSVQSELDTTSERKAQEAQAPTPTPTPTPEPVYSPPEQSFLTKKLRGGNFLFDVCLINPILFSSENEVCKWSFAISSAFFSLSFKDSR